MTAPSPQDAHPLADTLAKIYRERKLAGPILEIAGGNGRNTRRLVSAGFTVLTTQDDEPYTQLPGGRGTFAAALSTHAYLHGAVAKLRLGLAELRRALAPDAPIAITLGSIRDARFGYGEAFDENTYAPGDGDEVGIPHAYFDRDGATELLKTGFTLDSLEERNVDAIVGRWAHDEPIEMWHWFVIARSR